jgi:hypothetical protein
MNEKEFNELPDSKKIIYLMKRDNSLIRINWYGFHSHVVHCTKCTFDTTVNKIFRHIISISDINGIEISDLK